MVTSLSVDEILLPRYVNFSTNIRSMPVRVEMAPSRLKDMDTFISVHVETNALLKAMQ